MRSVFILTLVLSITIVLKATPSKDEFKEQFLLAEDYIQAQEFNQAASILEKLITQHPDNANLQFKLGFCYLKSNLNKQKAISYLENAAKKISEKYDPENPNETLAPLEAAYYLAQSYYYNYQFDKAKKLFESFKGKVSSKLPPDALAEIDRMIQVNENARALVNNPLKIKVNPLPKGINSSAIEYSPVISGDESTLIFTSNRIENGTATLTNLDDIYISIKENGEWNTPQKLEAVCLPMNESTSSLTFDGNTLVLYINTEDDGNLYESHREGDSWTEPEEMPFPINSPDLETNGCYSPDKSMFYFTSDRLGGYGGLDIYVTRKMANGLWTAALNLGPAVNTPYDEESPFIQADNERMFFSSAGHNSMGGLDVFVVKYKSVTDWGKPENIGYPINSTGDDVGFTVSVDGRRGYYASYNEHSLGETDLFMIEMPDKTHTNLKVFVGYARDGNDEIIDGAEITAYDESGEMFGIYIPNPRTGKFIVAAEQGQKLELVFEAKGYDSFTRNIIVGSK